MKSLKIFFVSFFLLFFLLPVKFSALTGCDFLPCEESGGEKIETVDAELETWVRFGLSAVFAGIIALGIFQIIRAALKIIRSEGNQEQVEGGVGIIKGVWFGIGLLFVGIVGLILVVTILGSTDLFKTEVTNPDGVDIPFIN